jgi:hypothetical protein
MINKPFVPKFYKDLQIYYRNKGMKNEADAFEHLMRIRFYDNNSYDNREQSRDNTKSD